MIDDWSNWNVCADDATSAGVIFRPERAERLAPVQRIADDVVERLFDLRGVLMSDESSLWDFVDERKPSLLREFAIIQDVYGVDAGDVENGNIAVICERIAAATPRKTARRGTGPISAC